MTESDAGKHSRLTAWRDIPRTPLGLIVTILTGVTLLLVAGMILMTLNISSLREDTSGAMVETETALAALMAAQEQARPGWVRSDFVNVQSLGWGFLLVDFAMEETEGGGTTVSGSIINSTALDHYDATFRVLLTDDHTGDFIVDTLESGGSDSFEVTIPDTWGLSVQDIVRIIYLGSEIEYY